LWSDNRSDKSVFFPLNVLTTELDRESKELNAGKRTRRIVQTTCDVAKTF